MDHELHMAIDPSTAARRGRHGTSGAGSFVEGDQEGSRRAKRAWLLEGTGADRSDKVRWKAIRDLKREYAPSDWERTGCNRAPVPRQHRVAEAAKYLATQHGGDSDNEEETPPAADGPRVQGAQDRWNDTTDISMDEMDRALTCMAKNKSPGPDMIPAEVLQALDGDNRERLRRTLDNWYRTKVVPAEAMQAEVVTLFKKGNPK